MSRPARNVWSPIWMCMGTISIPSSWAMLSGISDVLSVTILILATAMASSPLFRRDDVIIQGLPACLHLDLHIRKALVDSPGQRLGIRALHRAAVVDRDDLVVFELHALEQVVDDVLALIVRGDEIA